MTATNTAIKITFTYKGKKDTIGTLFIKDSVVEFSEDLSKRGTYVKLGDNCKKDLEEGKTYTFDGFVHQKNNIYIFNPII